MNDIKKVAFVTGASRGIGKAIVEKLASDGFKVGFSYVSSDEKAKAIVDEMTEKGLEVFSVKYFQEVEDAFDKIYEEHRRIDVLVNNAGITRDKLFSRMKEDDFDQVIDTNLKGIFNCSKQVARKMSKQKSGRIINISSLAGLVGNIGQVNYSASKAGVIGFTRSLAAELGAYGITVNAVAPGLIKTDMTDAIPDQIREGMIKAVPLKRIGQPEDIGNVVSFLAGETGSYITGQVISVDGGLSSI